MTCVSVKVSSKNAFGSAVIDVSEEEFQSLLPGDLIIYTSSVNSDFKTLFTVIEWRKRSYMLAFNHRLQRKMFYPVTRGDIECTKKL